MPFGERGAFQTAMRTDAYDERVDGDLFGVGNYGYGMERLDVALNLEKSRPVSSPSEISRWEAQGLNRRAVSKARIQDERKRLEKALADIESRAKAELEEVREKLIEHFGLNINADLSKVTDAEIHPSQAYKDHYRVNDNSHAKALAKEHIQAFLFEKEAQKEAMKNERDLQFKAYNESIKKKLGAENDAAAQNTLYSLLGLNAAQRRDQAAKPVKERINQGNWGKTQFQIKYDKNGKVESITIMGREGTPGMVRVDEALGTAMRGALEGFLRGEGFNIRTHDKEVINAAVKMLKMNGCKEVTVVTNDHQGQPTNTALTNYAMRRAAEERLEVTNNKSAKQDQALERAKDAFEKEVQDARRLKL